MLVRMEVTIVPLPVAARRLRVPRDWLRAETAAGRLPGLAAGSTYIYDLELLTAALKARVRKASPHRTGRRAPASEGESS